MTSSEMQSFLDGLPEEERAELLAQLEDIDLTRQDMIDAVLLMKEQGMDQVTIPGTELVVTLKGLLEALEVMDRGEDLPEPPVPMEDQQDVLPELPVPGEEGPYAPIPLEGYGEVLPELPIPMEDQQEEEVVTLSEIEDCLADFAAEDCMLETVRSEEYIPDAFAPVYWGPATLRLGGIPAPERCMYCQTGMGYCNDHGKPLVGW